MISRALPFLIATIALGQAQFDVIAIHPIATDTRPSFHFTDSEFRVTSITVRDFILMAYQLQPFRLKGGPSWIETERFDISAKGAGDLSNADFYQAMRGLLKDRFHLTLRGDLADRRIYEIVIADRSKLKPSQDSTRSTAMSLVGTDELQVRLKNSTIADFTTSLSNILQAAVEDGTGLSGGFDFEGVLERPPAPTSPINFQPLLEKYGLRLEQRQAQVEIYTIETVERPSDN